MSQEIVEDLYPADTGASISKKIGSIVQEAEEWREKFLHSSTYLLLNPHRCVPEWHPLHPNAVFDLSREGSAVVLRPDLDWIPSLCPLIIRIYEPNAHVSNISLYDIFEQAISEAGHPNGAYVCGLIASRANVQTLARHLAKSGTLPGQTEYVPLFEPLRLERLSDTTPSEWFDRWLGPIDSWLIVSANGQSLTYSKKIKTTPANFAQLPPPALEAQFRIPELHRCLHAWKEVSSNLPPKAAKSADDALALAHEQQIKNLEDIIFFALLTLLYKSDWYMNPEAKKIINSLESSSKPLSETIMSLSDEALTRMNLNDNS